MILLACSSTRHVPPTPATAAPPPNQATSAAPVTPVTGPTSSDANPFVDAHFYSDPFYAEKVLSTPAASEQEQAWLQQVQQVPTALWIDSIAALENVPKWLAHATQQSRETGQPTVPVLVAYNLPNRDCAAKASSGELLVEEDGERRYREEYIDVLAQHLKQYPELKVAIVLEPDSLPNLVTNLGVRKCAVSQQIYKASVAYAIAQLSLPNVALYVDAAHGGWLGWEGNRRRMVQIFKQVLDMAGGPERVRGFATNVSNYNPLRGNANNQLESTNPTPNALSYVAALAETLEQHGIRNKGFLIDTSRNGRDGIRTRWGNWCNIAGAGLGERPQVAPTSRVDAYFWIKPPGDSDGTADPAASRFDESCGSADAAPGAPEAGKWFSAYFLQLVRNANPPL